MAPYLKCLHLKRVVCDKNFFVGEKNLRTKTLRGSSEFEKCQMPFIGSHNVFDVGF